MDSCLISFVPQGTLARRDWDETIYSEDDGRSDSSNLCLQRLCYDDVPYSTLHFFSIPLSARFIAEALRWRMRWDCQG